VLQEIAQFLRKGSAQFDRRAGTRLSEAELASVQEIARERRKRDFADAKLRRGPVQRVSDNRMAKGGKVDANLVRAAGMEPDFDQAGWADSRERAPVCARFPGIREHDAAACGHTGATPGVAHDGELDAAAFLRKMTFYESDIGFLYFALAKGLGELRVSGVIFCHEDYPGSVFIEAMHNSWAERVATLG
jgi:hypothetical protein